MTRTRTLALAPALAAALLLVPGTAAGAAAPAVSGSAYLDSSGAFRFTQQATGVPDTSETVTVVELRRDGRSLGRWTLRGARVGIASSQAGAHRGDRVAAVLRSRSVQRSYTTTVG